LLEKLARKGKKVKVIDEESMDAEILGERRGVRGSIEEEEEDLERSGNLGVLGMKK